MVPSELLIIDSDYRRYFISFFKSIFTEAGKFENLYSSKVFKPFVFSVYLGKNFKILKDKGMDKIQLDLPFHVIFSTGDIQIFTDFYNGVLEYKRKNRILKIGNLEVDITNVFLEKIKNINSDSVIFKTLGVCVLPDSDKLDGDVYSRYIFPDNYNIDKFNRNLSELTLKRYFFIKGIKPSRRMRFSKDINFTPIDIKCVYVRHYGGFIRGFRGTFKLEADPQILQFIYDYGLGVRTGQGFGLVEINDDQPAK